MLSISLLNVNYFCAATDEQGLEGETAENLTVNTTNMDTDNLELETTTDSDSEESLNETSENSTNTSTQNNLNETEITDDNTSDHENPQDNNSSVNILNIDDESMLAAGGDSYDNVTGIWMWSSHINSLNVTSLLNSGITDIFLYVNSTNYQTNINLLLEKLQDTGIRVHAWISCFKDSDDNWIDPKNTTHTNNLLNLISDIVSTTDVNGIHLDYVRYSGVGNNAAYKHENGTETITSFVENVYNTVNSIKTKVAVSAALMPEKSVNAYYYGQDYSQLSQFLDFLVPMIYKGNYNEDTDWIASTTEYIVGQANGKPVVAGIQTYRSDSDITKLSADELNQDVNAASDGGSSGYVLFRYGLIDENFWNSVNQSGDDSVSFTIDQIKSAAVWVKAFVEANGKLPDSVTIASKQVSMSQLLQLLTSSVLQINQGVTTPIKLLDVGSAPNPSGAIVSGNVSKSEYLKVASNLLSFFESNDRAPNYGVYSLGNVQFDYLVYSYSKIMDFYATNKRLPNYAIIKTSEMSGDNSGNEPGDDSVSFTIDQIKSAAVWVKAFVEANGKLPDSVTIASKQVSMSQLLQLLTSSVLQINQGVTTPIKLLDVGSAPNPSGAIVSGNVSKSEYLKVASNLLAFIDSKGRAPNWGVYSLGNVQFDYLVYSYSKIMDFYATNKRLPSYAIIKTAEMGYDSSIPEELLIYLQETKNAQSTNATIIALAKSITNGLTTNYEKADAIFKWVRDNLSYSFYYNTKYGATGILQTLDGNCIDHSHLIVALSRSVGIPARYGHAQCKFSSMTVGHVWAELYVNGKWYIADATSSRNTLGVMQNCQILYLKGANGTGIWRELPF